MGKAILHRTTPEGDRLVRTCDAMVADVMRRSLTGLSTADLRTFRECLQTIAEADSPA
jgi:hypothetical protein